jgi:hypothetical protein
MVGLGEYATRYMSKGLYLKEDEDLIQRLDDLKTVQTGSAYSSQQVELMKIQIEATLRDRKSVEGLNDSTEMFSRILIAVAIIQIMIAMIQLVFAFWESKHQIVAGILLTACVFTVMWALNFVMKPLEIKKKKPHRKERDSSSAAADSE